jgi:hypothetical protein
MGEEEGKGRRGRGIGIGKRKLVGVIPIISMVCFAITIIKTTP